MCSSYSPSQSIHEFWNTVETKWKDGAPRELNYDGIPVFKYKEQAFGFFKSRNVSVMKDLFLLKEDRLFDYWRFDPTEKKTMLEIMRAVKKAAITAGDKEGSTSSYEHPGSACKPQYQAKSSENAELERLRARCREMELEQTRARKRKCESDQYIHQLESELKDLRVLKQSKDECLTVWRKFFKSTVLEFHPDKQSAEISDELKSKRTEAFRTVVDINKFFCDA